MAEFQSRQGDLFFRSVSKLPPKGLKKKADAILAYGEVTGHSHQVTTPIADCEDIYIRSDNPINVGHDEHNTIVLPAGQWICVSRQREYDPLAANRERRVLD
jgi:hypothetical protein